MCQYATEYRLENLITRKQAVMKSLEWAIANNDRGMSEICERELKIILKKISKMKKEMEGGNQHGET